MRDDVREYLEPIVIAKSGIEKIQDGLPMLERMRDDLKMPQAMRKKLSEDIEKLNVILNSLTQFLNGINSEKSSKS